MTTDRRHKLTVHIISVVVILFGPLDSIQVQAQGRGQVALEQVSGQECYTYGQKESELDARATALVLAEESAIRRSRVYIQILDDSKEFATRRRCHPSSDHGHAP